LDQQTLDAALAPLDALRDAGGWNTTIAAVMDSVLRALYPITDQTPIPVNLAPDGSTQPVEPVQPGPVANAGAPA
jgi:hypothetical protein